MSADENYTAAKFGESLVKLETAIQTFCREFLITEQREALRELAKFRVASKIHAGLDRWDDDMKLKTLLTRLGEPTLQKIIGHVLDATLDDYLGD